MMNVEGMEGKLRVADGKKGKAKTVNYIFYNNPGFYAVRIPLSPTSRCHVELCSTWLAPTLSSYPGSLNF